MARTINRLKVLQVKTLEKPGWYPDGHGLYLQISKTGTKSWVYRYQANGKERRQGLGSYLDVSLEKARIAASKSRQLRLIGTDPLNHKHQLAAAKRLDAAKSMTFKSCATAYIDSHKAGWKNVKHKAQWTNTLTTYAYPIIGNLSVQDIDVSLILKILEPIWYTKTETATRVRQRIENVLDWAKARSYRTGENPALWRGHLDKILPKPTKVQKVKHHNAMPYADLPEYFIELRKAETLAAKALAFNILTATRTNETRQAKWNEINFDKKIWIIPDDRMKAGKEHRVPLSSECLKILKEAENFKTNDFVFPGLRKDTAISDAALLKVLKKIHPNLTVHGFRSSFRDWCAEMTNYPRELAESALAHTLTDKTEAAYQRGDMFIKRSKLMAAWSNYCLTVKNPHNIIPLNKQSVDKA